MSSHGRDPRTVQLTGLLREALTRQRVELGRAVDDEVLQYLCLSLQELQELQRAEPKEALERGCEALQIGISALRTIVEVQAHIDFAFEVDASVSIEQTLRHIE